jgi:pilus assembly protein CpaC
MCLTALPGAGSALAENGNLMVHLRAGAAERAQIPTGQSITVEVERQLGEIVVGDPKIADVAPISKTSLFVLGKGVGRTTVTIYDTASQPIGVIQVEVGVDVSDLSASIRQHLPGARVRVSTVNGRLRLGGTVQNGQALAVVLDLAKQYAGNDFINAIEVTDSQQVILEVRFVEVARSAGREIGVNLAVTDPNKAAEGLVTGDVGFGTAEDANGNVTYVPGAISFPNAGTAGAIGTAAAGVATFAATGNPAFATLITQIISSSLNVDVFIRALESKGLARRLAEPNLTALSGEVASFHAGGEVPITTEDNDGDPTIEYKKYGVQLDFTPVVLDNGLINLKLRPEVSQVDRSLIVRGNPSFITRNTQTTVELRDGQSFAIAGLLQSVSEKDVQQMPWLGQLPVLLVANTAADDADIRLRDIHLGALACLAIQLVVHDHRHMNELKLRQEI